MAWSILSSVVSISASSRSTPEDMIAAGLAGAAFRGGGRAGLFCAPRAPQHPDDLAHHNCVRYRFPRGNVYKWELAKGDVKLEVDVPGRPSVGDSELRCAPP
jgi:hypothetical protein